MTCPMRISPCTSTIETAVYVNRTHGGVRGRELVTPSYSIMKNVPNRILIIGEHYYIIFKRIAPQKED